MRKIHLKQTLFSLLFFLIFMNPVCFTIYAAEEIPEIDVESDEFRQYLYDLARGYYGISRVGEYASFYMEKGYESDVALEYAMKNVDQIEEGIQQEMITWHNKTDFFGKVLWGLYNTYIAMPDDQRMRTMANYYPHYQNFSKFGVLPFDEASQKANEALARKLSEYLLMPKNAPGQTFNFFGSNAAGLLEHYLNSDDCHSLYIYPEDALSRQEFARLISYADLYDCNYILYLEVTAITTSRTEGYFFSSSKPISLELIREIRFDEIPNAEDYNNYNFLIHGLSKDSRMLYLYNSPEYGSDTLFSTLYNDLYDYYPDAVLEATEDRPLTLKSIEQIEWEMDTVPLYREFYEDRLGYVFKTETFFLTSAGESIVMPPYPPFTDDLVFKPRDIVVPKMPDDLTVLPEDEPYREKIKEILKDTEKPDYPTPWWNDLFDFRDNILFLLNNTIGGALKDMIDLLKGILDFFLNLVKNLLNAILDLILMLFTLEEDYFVNRIHEYKLSLELKLNPVSGQDMNALLLAREGDFADIEGIYESKRHVFVNFQGMRDNLPQFRKWINGFFGILLLIFNMNQLLFMLRRTYVIKIGSGGSDDG